MPNIQYQWNVGQTEFQIVTTTDPNAITADVELNINTTSADVTDASVPGGVRYPRKSEILQAIEMLENVIVKSFPNE